MANTTWSTTDKTNITLSGSNLIATSGGGFSGVRTTDKFSVAGKYYFEITCTTWTTGGVLGIANVNAILGTVASSPIGAAVTFPGGGINNNGNTTGLTLGARANGDIIGVAVDLDNKLVWFRVAPSGNWNGNASFSPATATGGSNIAAITSGMAICPFVGSSTSTPSYTANFGDTAFSGSTPSGFTAGWPTPGAATYAFATQTAAEHWLTTNPAAQVTQVAIEHWAVPPLPAVQVTQIAVEEWGVGSPAARLTQVAVEEWGSVEASYAVPVAPAFMLAGSRAGIGSAVLVQDNATRTVMLAGIGALQQGAQTVVTPSAGDAVRAIIMA